jgi:predicted RNase H-like HicB family nuclease
MVEYAVVIERGPEGCGAYVPDLPGCVAAAKTELEVRALIREAIEFHIEGLRLNGDPVPPPTSKVDYVQVAAVAA